MLSDAAFLLTTGILQAGVALILRRNSQLRWMSALLALNAAVSVATMLEGGREGLTLSGLLDVPSAGLIALHLLFTRRARTRWLWVTTGLMAIQLALYLGFPEVREGDLRVVLASIPLFAAYGALGLMELIRPSEPIVLAAFSPRITYFGALLLRSDLVAAPVGWAAVNHGMAILAALLVLAAGIRHIMQSGSALPLACAGTGIVIGVSVDLSGLPVTVLRVVNFFTLSLLRPIVLGFGLVGEAARWLAPRVGIASGLGVLTLLVSVSYFAVPEALAAAMALALAATVLGMAWQRGPPSGHRAPHWQTILLALRGSSLGAPRAAWTQTRLARDLGIGRRRVSEFPARLNETAAAKLQDHLGRVDGRPTSLLVTTHEGVVEGMSGVRTYYRLTEPGERLAETVSARSRFDGPKKDVRTDSAE